MVALLIIGSSIKAGLIILWAAFRSAHLSYEAYLISKRYYFHVSSLYLYHIVGALFIAFGVFNNSLTSLNNVLFAFVVLEFIAIPLIGGHISTQSTWGNIPQLCGSLAHIQICFSSYRYLSTNGTIFEL